MKLTAIAAGSMLAATLAGFVEAAEVTEQGARDLQAELTRFLPEKLAKSGFIAVTPDGVRYAVVYQFSKLLEKADPKSLTIDGLQPMTMFAAPLQDGLWKVDGSDGLDISGQVKVPNSDATHFNYSIGSFVYSGVFDPAITYFRSGEAKLKNLKATSITGAEKMVFRLDDADQSFGAVESGGGKTVDFTSKTTGSSFYQQIASSDPAASVEVRAENFVVDAAAKGVLVKELRDLFVFVFEHLEDDKLTQASSDKFKTLLRAAMPLFSSVEENATISNVSIGTAAGDFGLKKIVYGFHFDGLSEASQIGFALATEGLDLGSLPVPPAYASFVPDTTELQVAVPGLNFKAFIDNMLKFDLVDPEKIPPADVEKAGKAIFPNGLVTVEFPKLAARSASYDIEATGNVTTSIAQSDRVSLDVSVFARDYDKTIAAVQQAAKSDPQLNQVSLGLMMAKGFAKTEPDGRQRWDIHVDDDSSVSINGQALKGAN